jgi:hypothetical protein
VIGFSPNHLVFLVSTDLKYADFLMNAFLKQITPDGMQYLCNTHYYCWNALHLKHKQVSSFKISK